MKKTYILGHKKPDTDSVVSAIALSYLKNQLGDNTEARVLGTINQEAKFVLDFFGVKEPKYLNDVKLQLKDMNYHKGFYIEDSKSIYDGYQAMLGSELTGIPVCKKDGQFLGLVTLKDLSYTFVNENVEDLYTSYDNILHVLKAEEVVRCSDEIIGKLIVAAYRSTTFLSSVKLEKNNILIVGDRHSVIEYAVNSGIKCIIISGNSIIKEEHIEIARRNGVNVIRTPYDTYRVSRLISLANYIRMMITLSRPITFRDVDYVADILDINHKQKHTNYPVVDRKNRCLGLLKITDLSDKNPKRVILVDHNEKLQSVEGLEEADILEIIDHHAVGSITTNHPINYRNMVVGSTSTIVYTLYKEANVLIPRSMAGLMLSGILSDTLILKSPTTTEKDVEAVDELSRVAGVEYYSYGMELLKSGTSLEGLSKEDVLYHDYKLFTVNDRTIGIGQFFTMNFSDIEKELEEYVMTLDRVAEGNNYQLVALYVTDIIKDGSYVIYNRKAQNIMDLAYDREVHEGMFIEGCVSRKKHVVPIIMQILES